MSIARYQRTFDDHQTNGADTAIQSNLSQQASDAGWSRILKNINGRRNWSFKRIMTGFDEYGCGDRINEHLRRNLVGNLVRNRQERVVSNRHIFSPSAICWKECNTLAFAKPVRPLCVCSESNDRPDALKPRYSSSSFWNGLD